VYTGIEAIEGDPAEARGSTPDVDFEVPAEKIDAAAQAVFATTELLENVLVYLPMLDVLTSQRVCRAFRDTVDESLALQRKLFFIADAPYQTWHYCGGAPRACTQHGSEKRWVRTDLSLDAPPCTCMAKSYTRTPATLNPLLTQPRLPTREEEAAERRAGNVPAGTDATRCLLQRDLPGVFNKKASWRRMYLCDPAPTKVSGRMNFETNRTPVDSVECYFAPTMSFSYDPDHGTLRARSQDTLRGKDTFTDDEWDEFGWMDLDEQHFGRGHGWTFGDSVDSVLKHGLVVSENGIKLDDGNQCSAEDEIRAFEQMYSDFEASDAPRNFDLEASVVPSEFDLYLMNYFIPTEEEWRSMEKTGSFAGDWLHWHWVKQDAGHVMLQ